MSQLTRIGLSISLLIAAFGSRLSAQTIPPADRWEPEIRAFEQSDREHPQPTGGVLFLGGSTIRLWSTLAADFPAQKVVNRGFGGAELSDLTAFAGRIVTPYRPKMIVLYAGDNDVARGLSTDQVRDSLDAFVKRVRQDLPAVKIVFLAIKPSPERAHILDDVRAANAKIKRWVARQKDVAYVDVFTPMMTRDGKIRVDLYEADGEHLNRSAYDMWKAIIRPYMN